MAKSLRGIEGLAGTDAFVVTESTFSLGSIININDPQIKGNIKRRALLIEALVTGSVAGSVVDIFFANVSAPKTLYYIGATLQIDEHLPWDGPVYLVDPQSAASVSVTEISVP